MNFALEMDRQKSESAAEHTATLAGHWDCRSNLADLQ